MGTVGNDLDTVQAKLHDDGTIWSRTELLRWYGDGYRELLARSQAFSRFLPLDVPGRYSYALTHPWETRHTDQGTWWFPMQAGYNAARQTTAAWELEHLDRVTPSAALTGLTMQWERAHTGETDRHYSFGLPKPHERIRRLEWTNKALFPISVREFDQLEDAWMREIGEPSWWTIGVGPIRNVEVYEIVTTYQQGYDLLDASEGLPRELTGDRTYGIAVDDYNPSNSYAYANQGEMEALGVPGMAFVPTSAYAYTWELSEALRLPAYNFTINLTMNFPNFQYVFIHPWETENVSGPTINADAANPGQRGMFAWEADPSEAYESQILLSDHLISLNGMGHRFTKAATTKSNGFYVFPWEGQQLNGETIATFTTGGTIGMFPWEQEQGAAAITFGLGGVRSLISPDRQYLPIITDATPIPLVGGIRDWRSSSDNVMVLEVIVPTESLAEPDVPALIPGPLQKYLRFYTWSRAFGREGEGQRVDLAQHYEQRFQRGVQLFKRFADCAHQDRVYRRQDEGMTRARPPWVRLPSEFPAVF